MRRTYHPIHYEAFFYVLVMVLLLPMLSYAQTFPTPGLPGQIPTGPGGVPTIPGLPGGNPAPANPGAAPGANTPAPNAVADVLCEVGYWLWGPLGQLIGVLGIICLGLASMFGKLQVSSVLTTMAGIALIFGAQTVVNALGLSAVCPPPANTAIKILESPIYHVFGCLIKWFTGPIGKSLATVAIILLGIFALYGKISYHQGLVVGSGIAAMFGASTLIANLGVDISTLDVDGQAKATSFPLYMACADGSSIEVVYCSLINWFNGPLGKGMATVGIIIICLGALYGKVSWGLAIIAGVGAALIFGGSSIVGALGGTEGPCSLGTNVVAPSSLTVMFCNVINWFNGPIGKGIATLAVVIVGLGALFGKVSWIAALVVAVGVALIFGGTTMVEALGGPSGACPHGDMLQGAG